MDTLFLNEHRCRCGKLLLKGIFFDGTLEIKCKRCGEINKIGKIKLANDLKHYLLIINEKGTVVNVSDSACRILGYNPNELIGKHFTQINTSVPLEIHDRFIGPNTVLNENNYIHIDTFHQSKSGKKIPIDAFLKLYRPNDREKFILLSAKLKSYEEADKQFKDGEILFSNNSCDFYFEVDNDGLFTYISPDLERFFANNSNKGSLIGKNYLNSIPIKIKDEARKIFEYFSERALPFRRLNNIADINGKDINYELYFTPFFNDAGDLAGYRVLGWVIKLFCLWISPLLLASILV